MSATLEELVWFVPLGLVLVGALTVLCLDLVVPPKVPAGSSASSRSCSWPGSSA